MSSFIVKPEQVKIVYLCRNCHPRWTTWNETLAKSHSANFTHFIENEDTGELLIYPGREAA